MLRLALIACLLAAAAAVPVESDTEFCNGETECPQDCGYVSRNSKCVYCRCGDSPLILFPEPVPEPEPLPLPLPLPEPECEHGPAFIDECDNDCKCVKGGVYGCTRKLCMPGQTTMKPMTCSGANGLPKRPGQQVSCHNGIVKVQKEGEKCLPGAKFMDAEDCNSCFCSSTRVAGCTFKLCIPQVVVPEPECDHGPAFIDECDNDCKCVKGGVYGCTRKLCMPGQTTMKPMTCSGGFGLPKRPGQQVSCHNGIVKVQNAGEKCLPGANFMDAEDCNSCTCSSTGVGACTIKLCIAPLQPDTKPAGCPHGPAFIDECNNDCNCNDGRFYGCTKKACKSGEQPAVPMKCSSSENLPPRAGADVFCDEGIVKLQEKEAGCEHGPGFIDECNNDCHCNDVGVYGCTKKACKSGEQPATPMKCSSSENLPPRDRAHVFCDDGIVKLQEPGCETLQAGAALQSSCTVSASQPCPAGTWFVRFVGLTKVCGPPGSVCPHGDEFIDECGNSCRCLKNGYACTKLACHRGQTTMKPMACEGTKDLPHRNGKRVFCHDKIVKVQNEEDTCPDGAVYADECNDCSCLKGGKAACTMMACLSMESASTVTCEDGMPECPQDCGQVYNPSRDCFECPCGVGGPGDVTAQFGEPCPPGTIHSDSGAFFKTCKPSDKCPHGLEFIDECGNDCTCISGGYGCTRKACRPGQTTMQPQECKGSGQLPDRKGKRVFCHEGIVKLQKEDDVCIPGSVFKNACNSCFCGDNGSQGCTEKACL